MSASEALLEGGGTADFPSSAMLHAALNSSSGRSPSMGQAPFVPSNPVAKGPRRVPLLLPPAYLAPLLAEAMLRTWQGVHILLVPRVWLRRVTGLPASHELHPLVEDAYRATGVLPLIIAAALFLAMFSRSANSLHHVLCALLLGNVLHALMHARVARTGARLGVSPTEQGDHGLVVVLNVVFTVAHVLAIRVLRAKGRKRQSQKRELLRGLSAVEWVLQTANIDIAEARDSLSLDDGYPMLCQDSPGAFTTSPSGRWLQMPGGAGEDRLKEH